MANIERVSLALTPGMAATVREAERRGEHLSPSEVVRDALCMWRAYQAYRAAEIEAAAQVLDQEEGGAPEASPADSGAEERP